MSYPEHEKLKKIQSQSQICGELLEWLQGEKGVDITDSIENILSQFFDIDLNKLEQEKRRMLDELQRTRPS